MKDLCYKDRLSRQSLVKLIYSEDGRDRLTRMMSVFSTGQAHIVYFLHQTDTKTKTEN